MILDIKNVHKGFGGLKALDGCSAKIARGKITAIISPNGSGKSTLFNVISSLVPPDEGTIAFDGEDITRLSDHRIARLGISRTFQEVRLFENLTIRDHLLLATDSEDHKLWHALRSKDGAGDKELKRFLKTVHLDKSLDTLGSDLSYGQRKLLDLAIALAKPHALLLLDEPVAGVNPKLRQVIKKVIRELNKNGESILLIEHDMNFVMDLADQVIVMDEGKVLVQGDPKKVRDDKRVLEAYLGQ